MVSRLHSGCAQGEHIGERHDLVTDLQDFGGRNTYRSRPVYGPLLSDEGVDICLRGRQPDNEPAFRVLSLEDVVAQATGLADDSHRFRAKVVDDDLARHLSRAAGLSGTAWWNGYCVG